MQPKRDPNDRRYWPARLLGTGKGFGSTDKRLRLDYGGAIKKGGSLSTCPDPLRTTQQTVADSIRTIDPEAVKARARLLAIRLMDGLDESADSMDVSGKVDALNAVGKLTGAITPANGAGVTFNLGSLHLDALRAARPTLSNSIGDTQVVDAHVLPNPSNDNELDGGNPPGDGGSSHQG